MIEKWTPDLLTQPTTFYDLSVSRNLVFKAEMRLFGASGTDRLRGEFPANIGLFNLEKFEKFVWGEPLVL